MKFLKIALPILLLASACKKGDEDSDAIQCPISPVVVPVTVTDTNGNPLDADVEISTVNPENPNQDPNLGPYTVETACPGSNGSYTCNAYPGDDLNQITASLFPGYQPDAAQANVDGADCESVTVTLVLPVSVK